MREKSVQNFDIANSVRRLLKSVVLDDKTFYHLTMNLDKFYVVPQWKNECAVSLK